MKFNKNLYYHTHFPLKGKAGLSQCVVHYETVKQMYAPSRLLVEFSQGRHAAEEMP